MMADPWTRIGEPAAETPPLDERRLNGANWAILLISVALVVCSAAQLVYRLSLPTDGWRYIPGAIGTAMQDTITYDTNLIGQPSLLQPGDFVLAVEGYSYAQLLHNAETLQPPLIDDWRTRTTARYLVQRGNTAVELDVPLYRWQFWHIARRALGNPEALVRLVDVAIGLFVFFKRPGELAARIVFFLAIVWLTLYISDIIMWGLPEIIHPPVWLAAVIFSNWVYGGLAAPTLLLLALSFPQPKAFVRRHPLAVSFAIYGTLPLLLLSFGPQAFLGWGWTATCGLLSLISVVHSLVRANDRISRAQLRWAGLGVSGLALSIFISASSGFGIYPATLERLLAACESLLQLALPAALAIAILRYRLFDIDLILNRTLVYGALTLCVIGLYIGIVTYLGALFRDENNLVSSLIATGVVAVAFQPLRAWLQHAVNRLLFGQRDEPYTVIATLGRQLEITQAPDDVFAAIVETIGQTLKLPYVAITTSDQTQPRAVFQHPPSAQQRPLAPLLHLPLTYHNQSVGALLVAPRAGEAQFNAADHKLLHDLARQTGIAVSAAQMTADVQRSRERIVVAREEERRRLRRDLHDGLGPHLASQTLTLDVVARLIASDPPQAAALLLIVREQMQQAVSDIRDLIYGLRPPVLDDLGLNGAMQEFIERVRQQPGAPHFTLHLPTMPTILPAAVEVAVYRIFQEAIHNVVQHAQASVCEVRLEAEVSGNGHEAGHGTRLMLDVIDNGIGIAVARLSGVGLQSMRERSEELGGQLVIEPGAGGGTRIRAGLPIANARQIDDHFNFDR